MFTIPCLKKYLIFFLAPGLVLAAGQFSSVNADLSEKWHKTMAAGANTTSSAAIANLDTDSKLEVIIGTDLPTNGRIYAWNDDSSSFRTSVADGTFANTANIGKSSPAIADVDGDGKNDVAIATTLGRVYLYKDITASAAPPSGAVYFKAISGSGNSIQSSPVLADLDPSKTGLEIIVGTDGGNIYAWNHNGTGVLNADGLFASMATESRAIVSPAVADIDHDGLLEVIAVSDKGKVYVWRNNGSTYIEGGSGGLFAEVTSAPVAALGNASPAVADLDGDGKMEIIVGYSYSGSNKVYAWYSTDNNGDLKADAVPGWPKSVDGVLDASIVVADIDKKDGLEIIAATLNGSVYAWHMDGTPVEGWLAPRSVGTNITSSPIVADIDGDGRQEIVIGDHNGLLWAWNHDGSFAFNYCVEDLNGIDTAGCGFSFVYSSIVIEDMDKDGLADIVIATNTGKVWVLGFASSYNASKVQWAKFRKDLSNSGNYVRKPIFEDKFNTTLDQNKWTIHDARHTHTAGGKVIYGGDGTQYRSDGTGAKKKFKRDRNLIFLAEGFQFTELDPSYSVVFGGGRGHFIESPNSPHRNIVLTIEDPDKVKDAETGVITDGPEPPRFIVWRARGLGVGSGTHVVRSNKYRGDGSIDPYFCANEAGSPACDYTTRNSRNFPSEVPQVNTRYSAVLRWLGDPSEAPYNRIELYVFETDKGIDSVNGPVYVSTNGETIDGYTLGQTMDWDPGIGGGMWVGFGETELDYVAVYGEDDAVKLQNAPTISPVLEVFANSCGGVSLGNPVPHRPGTKVVYRVAGQLILGNEDNAVYQEGQCGIYGCTKYICNHNYNVDNYCNAGETPDLTLKSPAGAMFISAQHQAVPGGYVAYGSGYFHWSIPSDTPDGTYHFNMRLVSESGLQEEMPISVTVSSAAPATPIYGCGGGGGGCFLAGTPITMADGTMKPIEKIRRGDKVLAFDQETGQFKPDKVTKTLKHTSTNGYLLINGHLKVTPNHPVFSDGYWVQVGFLKEGNRLLNTQGEYEEIKTIERFAGNNTTYNMEVNPYHTYIAGGYVAHNGVRDRGSLGRVFIMKE